MRVTSSLPMSTRPAVGSSSPATIRSVVVLPHPDGPSSAKNEPAGIVRFSSSIAVKPGNLLLTPSSWRSAPDDADSTLVSGPHENGLERGAEGLLLGTRQRPERLHLRQ